MEIKYLGHSSFLLRAKTGKVVTDPFDPKMTGLKFPKQEADVVTLSHQHGDHNYAAGVSENASVFDWPGEFEKNGIRIFGYQSYHDKEQGAKRGENILFKFETENLSILHCGDLGVIPDDNFIDEIGDVDILMIPVGGFFTIDAAEAVKVVQKIEPSIVIPMHYATPELSAELAGKLAPVQEFLKHMGATTAEPLDKLIVRPEDLIEEQTKIVVMKVT